MRPCGKPLACYFLLRPFATANNGLAKGTQSESPLLLRKAPILINQSTLIITNSKNKSITFFI